MNANTAPFANTQEQERTDEAGPTRTGRNIGQILELRTDDNRQS